MKCFNVPRLLFFLFCFPAFSLLSEICNSALSQTPQWLIFNTENSGLPGNKIHYITVDGNNNKWICTDEAIARYDGKEWIALKRKSKKDPPDNIPRICSSGSNNHLWIGTWGDGMSKAILPLVMNKKTVRDVEWFNYQNHNSALTSNVLRSMSSDRDNNMWLGTGNGLLRIATIDWEEGKNNSSGSGMRWTVFDTSNSGLPSNRINSVVCDNRGIIWAGTYSGGLAKYDGMFWTIYNTANSGLPDNFILTVAIDVNNNKWIGTFNGGIARFDGKQWIVFNSKNSSLPDNRITMIVIDKKSHVYAGTYDSGLAYYNGSDWSLCRLFDSDIPYSVTALAVDSENNKWIGTAGGVVVYNEDGVRGIVIGDR